MATATSSDGTRVDYEEHGQGDSAIVLVHGITESRDAWRPIIDRLVARGHRVVALDLRGHGQSANADRYDLEPMVHDVVAVATGLGANEIHLVGHSLGGVVVSAAGAAMPVASVVNVDQALQLGGFKESLMPVEAMLRDPESFPAVISGVFAELAGTMLPADEVDRLSALRRPEQEVVLGVWDLIFSTSAEEINATVEEALAGYADLSVPYLSLFGIDPGPDYGPWIAGHITGAVTEVWADYGHYPHLIEPDRFVDRLASFWGE